MTGVYLEFSYNGIVELKHSYVFLYHLCVGVGVGGMEELGCV